MLQLSVVMMMRMVIVALKEFNGCCLLEDEATGEER